jgi:transposase
MTEDARQPPIDTALGQEGARMLRDPNQPSSLSEVDLLVFQQLVSPEHYLRRASSAIDFERFRTILARHYSPDHGAPAVDPVLMVKIEFLQYHDNLSDRQVIDRARSDAAYRFFLGLSLNDPLPDPSTLCYFRGRLGEEGHRAIFTEVIAQAREHGFVKDRLRLKDATHVIANVALPTTLALVAQVRNKLLAATSHFDALRVQGERARMDAIRQSTDNRPDEERLVARITHLREILLWVDQLATPSDPNDPRWQALVRTRQLVHKILADQADPKAGDRTRSANDPDMRRGMHGQYYDGYMIDVLMDADSEIITSVNVLPANGDEGGDAAELVRQEEKAHRNDVQQLSIDGAGFQGKVLRELEDPSGLSMNVFTPPRIEPASTIFTPIDFVEDKQRGVVTCPAGQTSQYGQHDATRHTTVYRFRRLTCAACPLLTQCMSHAPKGLYGRAVRKTDYEVEYKRAREKATTEAYRAVRREHPKIERKLSEMVWHGARRARYWSRIKVLCQGFLTAFVVNTKRMVQMICRPSAVRGVN